MLDKYFMKHTYTFLFTILFAGCSTYLLADPTREDATIEVNKDNPLVQANDYLGYHEDTHRAEIEEFTGVDPVYTQWCAAFVNAVLEESNLASLNTPGASHCQSCEENLPHPYPLTARSFLHYGISISKEDVMPGDLVIFPRGNEIWKGHVGFYLRTVEVNGVEYYWILGGNQSNKVSVVLYKSSKALGIRRPVKLING